MTAAVGGRFNFGAFDRFDAIVASSDLMVFARRAAVSVVAESFKLDVVNHRTLTDDGRSERKVLSSLAQIFGTVSVIKSLALSKFALVVTKKCRPSSSDLEVGSMLVKSLYSRRRFWTVCFGAPKTEASCSRTFGEIPMTGRICISKRNWFWRMIALQ